MSIITIEAPAIRLLQAHQAKQDVRYYLNGFLITSDNELVATDGHRLAFTRSTVMEWPNDDGLDNRLIINIDGKVPASSITCTFDLTTKTVACVGKRGRVLKTLVFQTIDGRFPDFNRVIPTGPIEPTEYLAINPKYLADASLLSTSRYPSVVMEFRGSNVGVVMRANAPYGKTSLHQDSLVLVMPMKNET